MKKYLKEIKKNPIYIKLGFIILVSMAAAFLLYVADSTQNIERNEEGYAILERGEGGENRTREMKVRVGGTEGMIDVSVEGREYTSDEIKKEFERIGENMEQYILGDNESLDEVRYDLNLVTEIPDSEIHISWETDRYDIMDAQGKKKEEMLTEEGTDIRLTATLSYGAEKEIREFYARLYAEEKSQTEEVMDRIGEEVAMSDERTRTEKYLVLPKEVDGQEVYWSYGNDTRASAMLVLGAGAAAILAVSESQKKKEAKKRAAFQMRIDYPKILSRFHLYISAGMTLRRAWFRIAQDYECKKGRGQRKNERPAYEEMLSAMYRMQSGAAEGECYEFFGMKCGVSSYRKFGMMLAQNVRKGTKGLARLLEREVEDAFEERKNMARKMGEEAGTKLMIPLFLMLIIVFAMVIVPAFFSIAI